MSKAADVIKRPLARDKSKTKRGFTGEVIRDGGDRGAGLIKRYSVITRGPALGHGAWVDDTFLQQVTDAINATGDVGLKSRFTHPGLSADGMGKFLGNTKHAVKEGDQVYADVHFSESAHNTPDGDLATYMMDMAEQDPDKLGSSIVFMHDVKSEDQFYADHENADTGEFVSPDPENKHNYYHVRLSELHAADMVDDPAANPGGLFHREQEIAQEATQLFEYALDLEGATLPDLAQFDVDPDRVKQFLNRFLDSHGLELTTKKEEEPMTDSKTTEQSQQTETQPAETQENQTSQHSQTEQPGRAEYAAELKKYTDAFGSDNGTKWFTENKSFSDAQTEYIGVLKTQLAGKDQQIQELQEKLSAINTGELEPFNSSDAENKGGKKSFKSCFRTANSNN